MSQKTLLALPYATTVPLRMTKSIKPEFIHLDASFLLSELHLTNNRIICQTALEPKSSILHG